VINEAAAAEFEEGRAGRKKTDYRTTGLARG
jgi:hypothetical protein